MRGDLKPGTRGRWRARLLVVAFLVTPVLILATLWVWVFGWRWPELRPRSAQPKRAEVIGGKVIPYAGSRHCRECHEKEYDAWKTSHHGLAERLLDLAWDRVAFDPPQTFRHGTQTSTVRLRGGRPEIITTGLSGRPETFVPHRVLGVNPLRQFLISAPGGRWQSTEIAFDPRTNDWFNVYGEEDRQPGEWGHWTGRGMTWNSMCAACHNTHLRKNYHVDTDSYRTTWLEHGVGCEACHGPMGDHLAWQRQHYNQKGDPTIRPLSTNQVLQTCGTCHARRAELTGTFVPGDLFADHYALTIPDETDIYYPDGQVRDENYEYASFLSSRMYLAGVWCMDCHDPHSGKTRYEGDLLCMRCHGPPVPPAPKIDPLQHSFHKPGTEGDRCVDCHMPQTVYMARHWRRDHGFTIPDPLLTQRYGIPNACNRCHRDKSVDWALEYVDKWYGARMQRTTRARAELVAQARLGQTNAVAGLVRVAREDPIPLWRATATTLLRPWAIEPGVRACLLERTTDSEPLVRAYAARALEPLVATSDPAVQSALNRLLQDPVRAVRVDAAWSLHAQISTNSTAGRDLVAYLHHNLDQPAGAMQMGVFLLNRGEVATAVAWFRRAVSWDTHSAPLRHALALGLSQQGNLQEAVRELEIACRQAPREAEYRYKLGLALNEVGRLSEAAAALEEATRLEPEFALAWYNLGLARAQLQQYDRSLEALSRAEAIDRRSARIPYARATVLAQLGRFKEARAAAARAVELQPGSPEAQALLQQLSLPGR